MDWIQALIDFILHIDVHLLEIVGNYGNWTYAILFIIIFAETGLVVTPFLPGDSLLFAAGTICALGLLNPLFLFCLLFLAAVLGDTVNYTCGSFIGIRIFKKDSRIFKLEYLHKTERFFEKYGGKTIVLARFVPIVRTYAPFVAGASRMQYKRFVFYNVVGGCLWVGLFLFLGYFFGNLPFVKKNFSLVVLIIIAISLAPIGLEVLKKMKAKRQKSDFKK